MKRDLLRGDEVRREYEARATEYQLASQFIAARKAANLTQAEVADRMGTTQTNISRLESGRATPSLKTIRRYAEATGRIARIELIEP